MFLENFRELGLVIPVKILMKKPDLIFFGLLILLPILWWFPLLTGHLPDFMDTVTYLYPLRYAIAEQWKEGTLPLWLPNILSGTPLAANPQLATWYPPQILFYFLPGPLTYGILVIFHYILAGFGMFKLCQNLTKNTIAAYFAAFTFQFSAMLISRVALLPHVYSAAWIPWIFLAMENFIFQPHRRIHSALTLAGLLSLQFLSGSPQISYYTVIALMVFSATNHRTILLSSPASFFKYLTFSAVLAFLICSIQLLPTIDFLQNVSRNQIRPENLQSQALNDGFIWRSLIGFTGPTIEDTDSINAIGAGAIIFALLSFFIPELRKKTLPYFFIALVGFILALGPLSRTLYEFFPLYDRFHAPRRALILWSVALPVCSALGIVGFMRFAQTKNIPRYIIYSLIVISTVGTFWMLPRLERVFSSPTNLIPPSPTASLIGNERFLVVDPTFNYAYDSRREDYGQSLMTNVSALTNLRDVQGYDPLVSQRYAYARDLAGNTSGIFFPSHGAYFSDPASSILNLLNVNYLIGRFDLYDPSKVIPGTYIDQNKTSAMVSLVQNDLKWPIYKYNSVRPKAWAVSEAVIVSDYKNALNSYFHAPSYEVAYFENKFADYIPRHISLAEVNLVKKSARHMEINITPPSNQSRIIAVSSVWYPGWKAETNNGENCAVVPVNGLIKGLIIPPSATTVHLTYMPKTFIQGSLLSGIGILIWSGTIFYLRRRPITTSLAPEPKS